MSVVKMSISDFEAIPARGARQGSKYEPVINAMPNVDSCVRVGPNGFGVKGLRSLRSGIQSAAEKRGMKLAFRVLSSANELAIRRTK